MKKAIASLAVLLMFSLPLQGMAGFAPISCHENNPVHMLDDEHLTESGHSHTDDQPLTDRHSSTHCIQCVSMAVLPNQFGLFKVASTLSHVMTATWLVLHSDVRPNTLERPPRKALT